MADPLNVVIDLSHYNEVTSFSDIKASGIVGVIHKATQGLDDRDPKYRWHRQRATAAGLWWGAYHFGTNADGAAQARFFLSVVDPTPQDLLALDFEQNGDDTMTLTQAEQFVTEVFRETGRYPGLYSDSLVGSLLAEGVNETLRQCWFWRAEYGAVLSVPPTWPTWTMWQYTDGEHGEGPYELPGIGGRGTCDRSKFNGDIDALAGLWGHAENVAPPETQVGPPLQLSSFMKPSDEPQTG
jgi:GH25 family lysozyme M1 (1,4-beta-N-acetylmuramidase)